jgi:hypothetical protein
MKGMGASKFEKFKTVQDIIDACWKAIKAAHGSS